MERCNPIFMPWGLFFFQNFSMVLVSYTHPLLKVHLMPFVWRSHRHRAAIEFPLMKSVFSLNQFDEFIRFVQMWVFSVQFLQPASEGSTSTTTRTLFNTKVNTELESCARTFEQRSVPCAPIRLAEVLHKKVAFSRSYLRKNTRKIESQPPTLCVQRVQFTFSRRSMA